MGTGGIENRGLLALCSCPVISSVHLLLRCWLSNLVMALQSLKHRLLELPNSPWIPGMGSQCCCVTANGTGFGGHSKVL